MIDVQATGGGSGGGEDFTYIRADRISQCIDSLSTSLRHISLEIHDHPEVRNKEFRAHEVLTNFMRRRPDQHWEVTPSAYGIGTAFVAVFDSGRVGPTVSFNAEYGTSRCALLLTG